MHRAMQDPVITPNFDVLAMFPLEKVEDRVDVEQRIEVRGGVVSVENR